MMFIECISMIMIVIMTMITIKIKILISMIITTVVLFCPRPCPSSPRERRRGRASEGEELLIKQRVRGCSTKERERKGRQLSRAVGQKCARMVAVNTAGPTLEHYCAQGSISGCGPVARARTSGGERSPRRMPR